MDLKFVQNCSFLFTLPNNPVSSLILEMQEFLTVRISSAIVFTFSDNPFDSSHTFKTLLQCNNKMPRSITYKSYQIVQKNPITTPAFSIFIMIMIIITVTKGFCNYYVCNFFSIKFYGINIRKDFRGRIIQFVETWLFQDDGPLELTNKDH